MRGSGGFKGGMKVGGWECMIFFSLKRRRKVGLVLDARARKGKRRRPGSHLIFLKMCKVDEATCHFYPFISFSPPSPSAFPPSLSPTPFPKIASLSSADFVSSYDTRFQTRSKESCFPPSFLRPINHSE